MLFVVVHTEYEGNKLSFSSLLNIFMKCILHYKKTKSFDSYLFRSHIVNV